MEELRFKRLTIENFQQPDPTLSVFVRFSAQDGSIRTLSVDEWAQEILAVELSERVPLEVQRLFAVARGALVYGYFFYPLYTLGAEQLFRVAETAVNRKCRDLGVSEKRLRKLKFRERVERLVRKGVIQPTARQGWEALWDLRNLTSHPERQSILSPGMAIGELRRIAADIDGLFVE
jgi:hypothetical protein